MLIKYSNFMDRFWKHERSLCVGRLSICVNALVSRMRPQSFQFEFSFCSLRLFHIGLEQAIKSIRCCFFIHLRLWQSIKLWINLLCVVSGFFLLSIHSKIEFNAYKYLNWWGKRERERKRELCNYYLWMAFYGIIKLNAWIIHLFRGERRLNRVELSWAELGWCGKGGGRHKKRCVHIEIAIQSTTTTTDTMCLCTNANVFIFIRS